MAVSPSALGVKPQFELGDGTPAVGYRLFFYVGGSVNTKQNTFSDSTGATPNANPLVLNSLGFVPTELWWNTSQLYKVVYAPPGSDDPPSSSVWTLDNVPAVNSAVALADQWVTSGLTPTFVNATTFTVPGDATSTFQIGRRVKTTNSGGTVYSTITNSVFGALTTVTVVNDSGVLDSGLSSVSYGLLSPLNPSVPSTYAKSGANVDITSLAGTSTNNDAAAGKIGEYITSTVLIGSAVSLTTSIAANITSISLTAGDWDVSGLVWFARNAATSLTQSYAWVSSTSATTPTAPDGGITGESTAATTNKTVGSRTTGIVRFSLSGTTTIYLSAQEVFTVNTSTAYGMIRARRVR